MQVNGVVERISERVLANGNPSYGLLVNGAWYSTFDKQQAAEGVTVQFTYAQKGNFKNINKGSIEVVPAGSPSAAPQPAVAAPAGPNSRDVSIGYQSSRKDAIATVEVLLTAGAVKLPSAEKNKYGAVLGLVDELTAKYYNDLQKVIEDGGVKEQAAPAPEEFA